MSDPISNIFPRLVVVLWKYAYSI